MTAEWMNSLLGGALIGVSVSLMLLWNGRVTGISGILNGALSPLKEDTLWRVLFLAGLFAGGLLLGQIMPDVFVNNLNNSTFKVGLAGLLVGFGTVMGSGCTSGHGVCGIARLSPRSIVATISFMIAGVLTVAVVRWLGEHL
jgi:uncharacterized protein